MKLTKSNPIVKPFFLISFLFLLIAAVLPLGWCTASKVVEYANLQPDLVIQLP